ncbi:MAG: HypC/HybG/HupF family hydrogenase formation chaperone [Chloroflexota bacterium]
MCLAVPRLVLQVDGETATVDWDGEPLLVSSAGVPDLQADEYVLIHAGMVLDRVSAEEAEEILALQASLEAASLEAASLELAPAASAPPETVPVEAAQ